jgi:NADH-quinone oxidoreductase subunit A
MEYGMMLMFLVVAILFVGAALLANRLIMPFRPNKIKNETYECGIRPFGDASIRYNIRFYIFALMYVVFAVESAFLFPWAMVYRLVSGYMPLVEALVFLFILTLALAYAWNKGALKWD